ncbi:hypothetical protein OSB04_010187 [Centaurea solstitialis]|uniref:Protein NO VEIN C-terminal domain-containing protein n=1 Tax=Centaurea solstitialis TaxID=347529 RepID=A0AA38TEM0_9ASTR|nr:hypothetical protein OSB04_010187 [Centaurea solstitialis]
MQGNHRRQGFAGTSRNNTESPSQVIARIDGAAVKAHSDLLAAGESVSAWRVAQSALVILKTASFESLGFRMQNIPSLNRLMLTEAKVNSFIHCFVGVQKLTSLHELEMAICESEGIKGFEELELGPILKHPLVVHYFSIGCDVTEMLKITSEQIVAYLGILLRKRKKVIFDDLLDYIAKRTNQSRGNLCIRIQSLGMHISHIMRGRRSEITLLKKCSEGLDVGLKLDGNEDDAGDNAKDEDNNDNDDVQDFGILSSQIATGSHSSAAAQFKPEFLKDNVERGFIDGNAVDGNTWMFIKTWKDTCEKENIDEAFGQMLEFYTGSNPMEPKKKQKAIRKMTTSNPHTGLLNVAIASMKFGLWNSIPQANNKEVLANTNSKTCAVGADTDVESAEKNVLYASKHVLEGRVVDGITWMFINTWKDICEKHNVLEVYDKMLDFYRPRMKPKRKTNTLKGMTSSYPHVGLLNVAIASIKFGLWDHMSSASQANKNEVLANTDPKACAVGVEPAEKDALVAGNHVLEGRVDIALEDVQKYIKEYFMSSNHVLDNMDSYPKKELIFLREIHKLERWLAEQFSIDVFETLGFGEIFFFLEDHVSTTTTAWQNCFLTTDKVEKPSVKVCMSDRYLLEFLSDAASSLGEHETLNKLMVSELLRMQYPSAGLMLIEDDFTEDLLTTLSKNGVNVGSNNVLFSSTLSSFRAEKGFTDAHLDTNNAVELLLRAPMLVDLALWSHWDYKFAPSLGPLLGWLLSDVKTKELLCLVTTNGEIFRVDHSATVDSFFEAFLHGSSFQTAISSDKVVKDDRRLSLASRFVIDCVGHIPKEFRRIRSRPKSFITESSILKKQHARLGRALHCLSQELYSQDSHFLLELVQNADDNAYPRNVEPTLTFILQENSIVVLNNEHGFSVENIRALCDVGNSTKKASGAGYIGKKGIGFKSVFRVSNFIFIHLYYFSSSSSCIKFRNTLNDSFVTMRKEIIGNGLINVSIGKETLTCCVFTGIGIGNDDYVPKMDQQYVFAFLPLRTYGLKFIIQGDFILPSSREEVDGDSPWNQWLLSEFPSLFVDSERSFCSLPGFRDCPGKGVSVFLSYVPLVGEVHGFFASLPRMIISKLCPSNCLLLEGDNDKWVPPCRVLRNWNEEAQNLLPDSLIQTHLGLGYLNKDIVLSDSLARALGIENYGPRILVQMLSSLCRTKEGLQSMGFSWLSSWLNALHGMSFSLDSEFGSNIMKTLRKTPFIPLLDGCYSSIDEGMIWMNLDASCTTSSNENNLEAFSRLFTNLRVVNPALFDGSVAENLIKVLSKVGVQRLSAHQVVKVHILPAVCDKKNSKVNKDLMTEYLSFIMVHLQSSCPDCAIEREHIISEVYNKAWILTNHGFVLPAEVAIHFGKDFGNQIDMGRLINGTDVKWYEIDNTYLSYPTVRSTSVGMLNWRKFLQELQVTDFVQIVQIEKTVSISCQFVLTNMTWEKVVISRGSTVSDWESRELVDLLTSVSSSRDCEKCKYLLEVLDAKWDGCFSDKVVAYCNIDGESKAFKSSLVSSLNDVQWVASSMDNKLYYPKDLFHDCEAVCSILGFLDMQQIQSEKLVSSIGLKTAVTLDDALSVLEVWKNSATSFKASVSQMSRFYSFVWNELASSNQKNVASLRCGAFIFIPFSSSVSSSEVEPGVLLSPQEVFWHDSMIHPDQSEFKKMLNNLYPSLHDFFVNECGVKENPSLLDYLVLLRHLSTVDTPLKAAKKVFDVFVMWSDGLKSGQLSLEDVEMLKKYLERKQMKVLPTAHDRWVSLHSSFGLVCWCDDEKLADEFEGLNNIDFLRLCELSDEEKEILRVKVSLLMKTLGIPALSEVVTREAIYYGPVDNGYETSLVNWVLPYAQRYICNAYPEKYLQHNLSGFEQLNRLQIVVVGKLFYKNVVKRLKLVSKKRHDIRCLLQDDILYATRESDSRSLFMELSRFLIDGNPELHLANFLHMIATMSESGSTVGQIEIFILNSQKVPKLMDEEPVWSILPPGPIETPATTRLPKRTVKRSRTRRSNRNPPPASSRTAPGFISSHVNNPEMPQDTANQIDLSAGIIEEHTLSTDQVQNVEPSSSSNCSNRNLPPASSRTTPGFISSHVNNPEMPQDTANQIDLSAGIIEEHTLSTDQVQNVEPSSSSNCSNRNPPPASSRTAPGFISSHVNNPEMPQDTANQIDLSAGIIEEHTLSTDQVQNVEPSSSSNCSDRNWPPARWKTAFDLNPGSIEEHIISTDQVQNVEPSTSSNGEDHGGPDAGAGLNAEPGSVDQDGLCSFSQKDRLSQGSANKVWETGLYRMISKFVTGKTG